MMSNRRIDGNHKLIQPYKIIIRGGLDGFFFKNESIPLGFNR